MITIKEVFDELFGETVFDKKLIEKVYRFQTWFLDLSKEHLRFFGSNLIGVHTIRWRKIEDTNRFFRDVLGVESQDVEEKVRTITTISHEFVTISDHLNLTMMYMIHRFLTSPLLNEEDRQRGAYDTALVFFYRCIAIRQSEYFKKFAADPKIAEAAYSRLNRKFLIRQLGTWGKVMEYRANALITKRTEGENELHYPTFILFTDDQKIANAIADSENRIRDLYKNYVAEFYAAIEEGHSISISSSTITDMEGIEKIKDKIKHVENTITLVQRMISDPHSFIRADLVQVIGEINTNTSQRMINTALQWVSAEAINPTNYKLIDEFVRLTITHAFHLLKEAGIVKMTDIPYLLITLKNLFLSTRSTDADLVKIRSLADKIVLKAAGKVNQSLALATRTSLILYLILFAIVTHK